MLRENPNNAYYFFYDCILRCVIGKQEWKRLIRLNKPISKVVSVSDEAFALLVLENSWLRWKYIFDHNIQDFKDKKKVKARYTKDIREGNASFDGWTVKGLQKYNKLICKVMKDRKDNAKFDSTYIQNLTNKCLPLWQNKRTKSELTSDTVKRRKVVVYNGFLDSEESFLEKQKKAEQEEEHYKQTMQPNYKHFDNMSYLDTYKDSTNQDEDTDDEMEDHESQHVFAQANKVHVKNEIVENHRQNTMKPFNGKNAPLVKNKAAVATRSKSRAVSANVRKKEKYQYEERV